MSLILRNEASRQRHPTKLSSANVSHCNFSRRSDDCYRRATRGVWMNQSYNRHRPIFRDDSSFRNFLFLFNSLTCHDQVTPVTIPSTPSNAEKRLAFMRVNACACDPQTHARGLPGRFSQWLWLHKVPLPYRCPTLHKRGSYELALRLPRICSARRHRCEGLTCVRASEVRLALSFITIVQLTHALI